MPSEKEILRSLRLRPPPEWEVVEPSRAPGSVTAGSSPLLNTSLFERLAALDATVKEESLWLRQGEVTQFACSSSQSISDHTQLMISALANESQEQAAADVTALPEKLPKGKVRPPRPVGQSARPPSLALKRVVAAWQQAARRHREHRCLRALAAAGQSLRQRRADRWRRQTHARQVLGSWRVVAATAARRRLARCGAEAKLLAADTLLLVRVVQAWQSLRVHRWPAPGPGRPVSHNAARPHGTWASPRPAFPPPLPVSSMSSLPAAMTAACALLKARRRLCVQQLTAAWRFTAQQSVQQRQAEAQHLQQHLRHQMQLTRALERSRRSRLLGRALAAWRSCRPQAPPWAAGEKRVGCFLIRQRRKDLLRRVFWGWFHYLSGVWLVQLGDLEQRSARTAGGGLEPVPAAAARREADEVRPDVELLTRAWMAWSLSRAVSMRQSSSDPTSIGFASDEELLSDSVFGSSAEELHHQLTAALSSRHLGPAELRCSRRLSGPSTGSSLSYSADSWRSGPSARSFEPRLRLR